ncbi:hypothetical protein AWM70_20095 [Paenibacillus yonginensis]|uniref:Uncharacterized protein n=1 Tax=Paenibacillus yonginensis TaxID=1462996 RepID=A0A1B1N582_9BACL|nr:hypothetical protein [Paenibacillus yonginensis]ANS76593.1 hypothetical protein AWM70_20095 [Paenibacillus yonginensis]
MTDTSNGLIYPESLIERAAEALRLEQEASLSKEQIVESISKLSKAELMDKVLLTYKGAISSADLFCIVDDVFGIELNRVPVLNADPELATTLERTSTQTHAPLDSSAAMDKQLATLPEELRTNGPELRKLINAVFGVNLDAIAGLEQCRIALHSKGQWIVRTSRDLVLVWTGPGDVDVRVSPTGYFREHTGLARLPEELRSKLIGLGYTAEEQDGMESLYYAHPGGQPVPDAFKGQTMGAIIQTLREKYMDL